jgi:trigger factor
MTNASIIKREPTRVELEIPIAPDELAAAEDRAFRSLVRHAKLPGFRKGHVPRKLFEQTYGTEAITERAMEEVIPRLYAQAVRDLSLEPVTRPRMELLPSDGEAPARIRAMVEVRPEIVLGSYDGIEVEIEESPVTDDQVERVLESLARDRATLVPVDREARLGDVLMLDYEGTIDGRAFEGGAAKDQTVELRDDRFIPGFAEGIVGMRAGEHRTIEARFPDDYGEQELAGKTARFEVTLHEVKEPELPALDDAFARSVSDRETLDELRAEIRRRLESVAQAQRRRRIADRVMERLLEQHDFPLPPSLVEGEIEQLREEFEERLARSGRTLEEHLSSTGRSREEFDAELRARAERRVKGTLLIEAIAKAEGIVATPADLQAELQVLAERYGQPVERIRATLGRNVGALMDGIVREKTLEFLVERARVRGGDPGAGGANV